MYLLQYLTVENAIRAILVYIFVIILKWLFSYIYKIWVYYPIPNRLGLPFIGNVHQYKYRKSEMMKDFMDLSKRFHEFPVYKWWFTTNVFIIIHKIEALESIFDDSRLSYKGDDMELLHPWLGTGLLTGNGEKWFSRRKLITPAFHFDILKDFLDTFNEHSDILINKLKGFTGQKVCLLPHLSACSLDIICDTAMGQHVNAQGDANSDYFKAVYQVCDTITERLMKPWLRPNLLFKLSKCGRTQASGLKILHGFTKKVIKERMENFEGLVTKSYKKIAFLDMLLSAHMKNPDEISVDGIQEEVDTFMFEGHDTTATALNFTTFAIATHPEVQKKLHKEIEEIFGNSKREVTIDDLSKLTYLECVIKESLRLYPPVPFILRRPIEDMNIGPYKILNDCNIFIYIIQINRDERYFPDPLSFKPERFFPENSTNRPAYCYVPFSAGRRNCVGQKFAMMELKVTLANILRNFELSCNQTIDELKMYSDLILRTEEKIMISLNPKY